MRKMERSQPELHGALLIDKPQGLTSADVVRRIKRAFNIKKVGHAGTLDPMATGLLVLLCGKATRLQSIFLESHKEYEGVIRLGSGTDTDDAEGAVIAEDHARRYLEEDTLAGWEARIRAQFSGAQQQLPPQYSAVKVAGRRSYARARAGEEVVLASRPVSIEFRELCFSAPTELRYRIFCSKGTYVRSLARDVGAFLGSCAHLESIRRTLSEPFSLSDATPLEAMIESPRPELVQPLEVLTAHLPKVELSDDDCLRLEQGNQRPLLRPELRQGGRAEEGLAAVVSPGGEVRALLERPEAGENAWRIRCMF